MNSANTSSSPVSYYWNSNAEDDYTSTCLDEVVVMVATAGLNTASEFIVAALPILAVFKLRVDPSQRWPVIMLLSIGFIVAFVGCVRIHYLRAVHANFDFTWFSMYSWICSLLEIDIALVSGFTGVLFRVFASKSTYSPSDRGYTTRIVSPTIGCYILSPHYSYTVLTSVIIKRQHHFPKKSES